MDGDSYQGLNLNVLAEIEEWGGNGGVCGLERWVEEDQQTWQGGMGSLRVEKLKVRHLTRPTDCS